MAMKGKEEARETLSMHAAYYLNVRSWQATSLSLSFSKSKWCENTCMNYPEKWAMMKSMQKRHLKYYHWRAHIAKRAKMMLSQTSFNYTREDDEKKWVHERRKKWSKTNHHLEISGCHGMVGDLGIVPTEPVQEGDIDWLGDVPCSACLRSVGSHFVGGLKWEGIEQRDRGRISPWKLPHKPCKRMTCSQTHWEDPRLQMYRTVSVNWAENRNYHRGNILIALSLRTWKEKQDWKA